MRDQRYDATRMGCAEAKYLQLDAIMEQKDATRMRCAEAKICSVSVAALEPDATRMGCAEDWSVSRAYLSQESIAATLTTVA